MIACAFSTRHDEVNYVLLSAAPVSCRLPSFIAANAIIDSRFYLLAEHCDATCIALNAEFSWR